MSRNLSANEMDAPTDGTAQAQQAIVDRVDALLAYTEHFTFENCLIEAFNKCLFCEAFLDFFETLCQDKEISIIEDSITILDEKYLKFANVISPFVLQENQFVQVLWKCTEPIFRFLCDGKLGNSLSEFDSVESDELRKACFVRVLKTLFLKLFDMYMTDAECQAILDSCTGISEDTAEEYTSQLTQSIMGQVSFEHSSVCSLLCNITQIFSNMTSARNSLDAPSHNQADIPNLDLRKQLMEEPLDKVAEILHKTLTIKGKETDAGKLIASVLQQFSTKRVECLMQTLMRKHMWVAAASVLQLGVSEELHIWTAKEICRRAGVMFLVQLPRFGWWKQFQYDQGDFILTQFVARGIWAFVIHSKYLNLKNVSTDCCMWMIEEAIKRDDYGDDLLSHILPKFCPADQKDTVLKQLVEHGRWISLDRVIRLGVSAKQRRLAIETACKYAEEKVLVEHILSHCDSDQLEGIIQEMETRGLRDAVCILLQRCVSDLLSEMIRQDECDADNCRTYFSIIKRRLCALPESVSKGMPYSVRLLSESLNLDKTVCQLMSVTFVHFISGENNSELNINMLCNSEKMQRCQKLDDVTEDIIMCAQANSVFEETESNDEKTRKVLLWGKSLNKTWDTLSFTSCYQLQYFCHFFRSYLRKRQKAGSDKGISSMLATVPLLPTMQNIALRIMMHEGRWDIIGIASLSHVWENVRRELFQEAVKQKKWSIVKQWICFTLYDDQRCWALEEAFRDNQWEIFMLLAEHGLAETELMRVHYKLAKYANWSVICKLLERGGDATELRQLLCMPGREKGRDAIPKKTLRESKEKRCLRLIKKETDAWSRPFNTAVEHHKWKAVLYQLKNRPKEEHIRKEITGENRNNEDVLRKMQRLSNIDMDVLSKENDLSATVHNQNRKDIAFALRTAVEKGAWHVVLQLVRIGIDAAERDLLFCKMVERQQWGVCRALLEQGVSSDVQMRFLPELQSTGMWVLICRMMEYNHGDSVIREVMEYALERREGSVVWHCMRLLKQPLTLEERKVLFQKALSHEIWQAVKPLTEEKDSTGKEHRDIALLEATEHRQWDVVDHCQRYYGDIDKQDASGETALQKAAKNEDWKMVEELIWRGADQFQPDSEGYTALQRAANAKQWEIVKLLVQFHGDLNRFDPENSNPIQKLIDYRQSKIIDESLFWGQNISTAVNHFSESPLHAASWVGDLDTMKYLLARGVNPFTVNVKKQSVLMYGVMNEHLSQRIVADCIGWGISSHQPKITDSALFVHTSPWYNLASQTWISGLVSPFEYCVLHGLPVIGFMLLESGACSYKELFRLQSELESRVSQFKLQSHDFGAKTVDETTSMFDNILDFLPHVKKAATTPRSLKSTCRLVISRHLKVGHRRKEHVQMLLLTKSLESYVMFDDLTDTNYCPEETALFELTENWLSVKFLMTLSYFVPMKRDSLWVHSTLMGIFRCFQITSISVDRVNHLTFLVLRYDKIEPLGAMTANTCTDGQETQPQPLDEKDAEKGSLSDAENYNELTERPPCDDKLVLDQVTVNALSHLMKQAQEVVTTHRCTSKQSKTTCAPFCKVTNTTDGWKQRVDLDVVKEIAFTLKDTELQTLIHDLKRNRRFVKVVFDDSIHSKGQLLCESDDVVLLFNCCNERVEHWFVKVSNDKLTHFDIKLLFSIRQGSPVQRNQHKDELVQAVANLLLLRTVLQYFLD